VIYLSTYRQAFWQSLLGFALFIPPVVPKVVSQRESKPVLNCWCRGIAFSTSTSWVIRLAAHNNLAITRILWISNQVRFQIHFQDQVRIQLWTARLVLEICPGWAVALRN